MKRYNNKARMATKDHAKQAFSDDSDDKSNSSSIRMKKFLSSALPSCLSSPAADEELWGDITENTSHCSESFYEVMSASANWSDFEETSLSSADSKASWEKKHQVIESSTTKTPEEEDALGAPIISCRSQHSMVSDITDSSSHGTAKNLKNEVAALEYIVSKQRKYYSQKEISNRLERLQEGVTESLHREEEDSNPITKPSWQNPRRSRMNRHKKSHSTEDTPRTKSLVHRDTFAAVKQQRSRLSLDDGCGRVRTYPRQRSRPASVSLDDSGLIIEQFSYRSRPSTSAAVKSTERGSNLDTESERRERHTGNLWGAMVKRYTIS